MAVLDRAGEARSLTRDVAGEGEHATATATGDDRSIQFETEATATQGEDPRCAVARRGWDPVDARGVRQATADADDSFGAGAADCVRQPGESAAGAGNEPESRDECAYGSGCAPRENRSAAADGELAAG